MSNFPDNISAEMSSPSGQIQVLPEEVGDGMWRKAMSRFIIISLAFCTVAVVYLFLFAHDPEVNRKERSQKLAQQSVPILRKVQKAIVAYRKDIGDYPIQIEDLVPKYLPSIDDTYYESGEGRSQLIYMRPDESFIPDTPILKARIFSPVTSVDAPKWDVTISTESLMGGLRYRYDHKLTVVDLEIKPK